MPGMRAFPRHEDIGSVSHEECLLQWAWIVVVPIVAILVTVIFL